MEKSKGESIFKEIPKTIIVFTITTLLTVLISAFSQSSVSSNGFLHFSQPVQINSNLYISTFDLISSSYNTIDNFTITIPFEVFPSEISTSIPVDYKIANMNNNFAQSTVLTINNLLNNQKVTFLITSKYKFDTSNIKTNASSQKIIIDTPELKYNLWYYLKSNLFGSLVFAIILSTFYFIESIMSKNAVYSTEEIKKSLTMRIEDYQKEIDRSTLEVKQLRLDLNNEVARYSKSKIILESRIREYKKELEFWRNTIRKLVYSKPKEIYTEDFIVK
jgi:hypothetical protein